jgi:hypothetical protein
MVTDEEIDNHLHESVHLQVETNEHYLQQFGIGSFERWDYDMDKETLTFSHEGVPHVVAAIQVAGSISNKSNTWLWGWANQHFPENVTKALSVVREFGKKHEILKLTQDKWAATIEDGWEMSAVANRLINGKGVYRCPTDNGFLFLILTQIDRLQ